MLAKLPPEQLHTVACLLDGAVEIHLPPSALAAAIHEVADNQERRQFCLQRGEWLIRNGGSNRMILLLCPVLCDDDIRQLRRRLGIPVNKGRLPSLPLEVRLSVAADWQATAGEADTFLRYRALAERHPGYTLGQLYSTVAAVEGGCLGKPLPTTPSRPCRPTCSAATHRLIGTTAITPIWPPYGRSL